MMVEALYRDGHKEKVLCGHSDLLKDVVETAKQMHPNSDLKHLKVVDRDRNHRRVD